MFQDEAGFGRINKPKYCWCEKGIRPCVPCHHIREYRYAFGAVEPLTGDSCFLVMPECNTVCMNLFLKHLSEQYVDDVILLCCDGAAWHKSKGLDVPENIVLFYIPPYTPEMNPIEQIWKEIRKRGFCNEVFASLEHVVYNGPLVKTTLPKKYVNQDLLILTLSRSEPPLKAIRAEAAAAQRFSLDRAAMACYTSNREGAPAFRFDSAAPSPAPAQQASGALSRSAESGAKQAR